MTYTFNTTTYTLNAAEVATLAECEATKAKAYALTADYTARATAAHAEVGKAAEAVREATEAVATATKASDEAKAAVYEAWQAMRHAEAEAKAAKTKEDKATKAEALKEANVFLTTCEKNAEAKAALLASAEEAKATAYGTSLTAATLRDAHIKAANAAARDYNGAAVTEVLTYAKTISRTMTEAKAEAVDRRATLRAYWFSHRAAEGIAPAKEGETYVVKAEAQEIAYPTFDRAFHVAANDKWAGYLKILVNNIHRYKVATATANGENAPTIDKPLPVKLVNLRDADAVFTAYATKSDIKAQMARLSAFMFETDAPAFIGGTAFRDFVQAIDQYKVPPAGVDAVAWQTRKERALVGCFINVILSAKAGKATHYEEAAMYSKSDLEIVDA